MLTFWEFDIVYSIFILYIYISFFIDMYLSNVFVFCFFSTADLYILIVFYLPLIHLQCLIYCVINLIFIFYNTCWIGRDATHYSMTLMYQIGDQSLHFSHFRLAVSFLFLKPDYRVACSLCVFIECIDHICQLFFSLVIPLNCRSANL